MKILEISTGPRLEAPIEVSKNIRAIPLGTVGAAGRVGVLAELHLANLKGQADLAEPTIMIEIDVAEDDSAISESSWQTDATPIFERTRNALALVFGEGFSPFAEIAILKEGIGLNLVFPRTWNSHRRCRGPQSYCGSPTALFGSRK